MSNAAGDALTVWRNQMHPHYTCLRCDTAIEHPPAPNRSLRAVRDLLPDSSVPESDVAWYDEFMFPHA